MPRDKERLKRSHNGLEIGFANSFNILLFILSGPEDFPSLSVCNTRLDLIICNSNIIKWFPVRKEKSWQRDTRII